MGSLETWMGNAAPRMGLSCSFPTSEGQNKGGVTLPWHWLGATAEGSPRVCK